MPNGSTKPPPLPECGSIASGGFRSRLERKLTFGVCQTDVSEVWLHKMGEPVDQGEDAVTKAPLTGIPQIDYVWDPNLPRELRGANLSNYPFLDSVPAEEDIGFTCDPKLHDGFYASIKYNCQLYHHCIHGIRYDFLCANYTAFDQKTFICHFASEVDCKNSPKYWFRNEPLYKATTTTTVKPPPTTSTTAAPTTVPSRPKPLRKPVRRRRPQVDYYYYDDDYEEDYYEERNRRRKNRPRNRRPIYDDYEEDERFDRRPMAADRYRERERDRDDEEEEYEDRRPYRMKPRTRNGERRPVAAAAVGAVEDDRRYYDDRRRRPLADERRRPAVIDEDEKRPVMGSERRRVPAGDRERRPPSDRRSVGGAGDDRRSFSGDAESRRGSVVEADRKPLKRPLYDDRRYVDDEEDDYDAPAYAGRRGSDKGRQQAQQNDVVTVKPSGSSIYDRPRAAPRINRPVPLNEKSKYAYGTSDGPGGSKTSTTAAPSEPEYYDEYEDEEPARPREPVAEKGRKVQTDGAEKPPRPSASSDVVYYDDVIVAKDDLPFRPVAGNVRKPEGTERVNSRDNSELANANGNRYTDKSRGSTKHQATAQQLRAFSNAKTTTAAPVVVDDGEEDVDEEYDVPASRPSVIARPAANLYANFKNKKQQQPLPSANTETVSARTPVRSTKRPFLPSRGGNPYLARGLQPVGVAKQPAKAVAKEQPEQPAPFRIDVDSSTTTTTPGSTVGNRRNQQTTSQQPEVVNVKTLDQLYDDEFDVTLNDALNPTLKPLTRSAPQNFFRNRYVHQPDAEFVPFEPSYAPSEFRRTAVRPPPVLYHPAPAAVAINSAPQHRQRYDAYAAYEY
ncbi:AGAP005489-PA-like protein [Anopheles sinensis]|uniref:AGAP005489-PA-like protein n=1 Tax=Anopheles sinensis TaxID=74873 RepID=A0A084W2X4_ANOSI|nr:AGAP005489-PA-like protein [Anopheles sinensis]